MSAILRKYVDQLKFIANIKNKNVRDTILHEFSNVDNFFGAIKEIVENTMQKNLLLKPKEKRRLRKYIKMFQQFIKPSIKKRHKQKLVSQSGGFLPILMPILASFLASSLSQ